MENDLHLPENLSKVIAVVLFVSVYSFLIYVSYVKRVSIWEALLGDNKKLDWPEFIVLLWTVTVFGALMPLDMFLGFHASSQLWASVDIIMTIAISGRIGLNHVANKNGKKT